MSKSKGGSLTHSVSDKVTYWAVRLSSGQPKTIAYGPYYGCSAISGWDWVWIYLPGVMCRVPYSANNIVVHLGAVIPLAHPSKFVAKQIFMSTVKLTIPSTSGSFQKIVSHLEIGKKRQVGVWLVRLTWEMWARPFPSIGVLHKSNPPNKNNKSDRSLSWIQSFNFGIL